MSVAAVGLAVMVTWWLVRRSRRTTPLLPTPPAGIDPADAADIEARLSAVDRDQLRDRDRRLAQQLHPLVERRVPARHVEPGPGLGAARIRFADGTTVLARGADPADIAVLAAAMRQRSMPPATCATDADGTHLVFRWPGRRRTLSILVTGLDQPD